MRKVFLLVIIVFALQTAANAQPGVSVGAALSLASPSGDFGNIAGNGVGGAVLVKFGLLPIVDLTGSIDYITFAEKGSGPFKSSATMWGFNVGGRVSVLPMIFGGLELGTYAVKPKLNGQSKDSNSKSAFAPIVGAHLGPVEGSLRYVLISDANFFGARLGLWF